MRVILPAFLAAILDFFTAIPFDLIGVGMILLLCLIWSDLHKDVKTLGRRMKKVEKNRDKALLWRGGVDEKLKLLDEVRAKVDQLLGRESPTTKSSSPLRLSRLGEVISKEINATEWVDEHETQARTETEGKPAYEVQEFCLQLAEVGNLSEDYLDRARQAAFEHGIGLDDVLKVFAIVLRDRLLGLKEDNWVEAVADSGDADMSGSKQPHERFLEFEEELKERHPDCIEHAKKLGDSVVNPYTANADQVWSVLWNKPLFANTNTKWAEEKVSKIEESEKYKSQVKSAWRIWGASPEEFSIQQVNPGRANKNFPIEGATANELREQYRIAPYRLYSIQCAADALRKREKKHGFDNPLADILEMLDGENYGECLLDVVELLQEEFGYGWGPLTVLHALTDFGLAVKADRHVVRTVRALGLCDGLPDDNNLTLNDMVRIAESIRQLIRDLDRHDIPEELRYTDKVLMDISRCGLLGGSDISQRGGETASEMRQPSGEAEHTKREQQSGMSERTKMLWQKLQDAGVPEMMDNFMSVLEDEGYAVEKDGRINSIPGVANGEYGFLVHYEGFSFAIYARASGQIRVRPMKVPANDKAEKLARDYFSVPAWGAGRRPRYYDVNRYPNAVYSIGEAREIFDYLIGLVRENAGD